MHGRTKLEIFQDAANNANNTAPVRTALANIANAADNDAAIRAALMADKDNLQILELTGVADFADQDINQLQNFRAQAKEKAILKTIASLTNTPDTITATNNIGVAENNEAAIRAVLFDPNKANLGLAGINDFDGLTETQLRNIRTAAIAKNKVLRAMQEIATRNNDQNVRDALARVAAVANGNFDAIQLALMDGLNEGPLNIAAIQLFHVPVPTLDQLRPLLTLVVNQGNAFILENAVKTALPELRPTLLAISADPNLAALTTALNNNRVALGFHPNPPTPFTDITDAQKTAIYNAAVGKIQEFIALDAIAALVPANDTDAIRNALLAIIPSGNDGNTRDALVTKQRALNITPTLPNFDNLDADQLTRIRAAALLKYKHLQALNIIANLHDPAVDNIRTRLQAIGTAGNDADTITALNDSEATLHFNVAGAAHGGGAGFAGLQAAELQEIRTAAEIKFKELVALNQILTVANNTPDVRNALSTIRDAADAPATINDLNAARLAPLNFNLPVFADFANLTAAQAQLIRETADRKTRELIALDAIPNLRHTDDAVRNGALQNSFTDIGNQADKIAALNNASATLDLALNFATGLQPDQVNRIVAAVEIKQREFQALAAIKAIVYDPDPALREALGRIATGDPANAGFIGTLNNEVDALGLGEGFNFNNLDRPALLQIHTAAVAKRRELLLLHVINTMETPAGAGDNVQALIVLNSLNITDPDPDVRRPAIRNFIYGTLQDQVYIDVADFGLTGDAVNDRNILSDALIDQIQVAAQNKITTLRRFAEPNHDRLAELRAALLLSPPNRDTINNVINRIPVAEVDTVLGGPAPNLSSAINHLRAQLVIAPPAPGAPITLELARAMKSTTIGLEQHLVAQLLRRMTPALAPDAASLALINTHADRILAGNGLSGGHPLRKHVEELRAAFADTINGAYLDKPQRLQNATATFIAAVEKQQLLLLTQILRNPGPNQNSELEILLPHLDAADGLPATHFLKTPHNFLTSVFAALEPHRIAKAAYDAAVAAAGPGGAIDPNIVQNKEHAEQILEAALNHLKTAIKDHVADLRAGNLNPELQAKARALTPAQRKTIAQRLDPKIADVTSQLLALENEARAARESRHRAELLPAINKRVEEFKLSAHVYRESLLEARARNILLNFYQTQLMRALINLLQPAAAPVPTNAAILVAITNLRGDAGLPPNHIFRDTLDFLIPLVTDPAPPAPPLAPLANDQKEAALNSFSEHADLLTTNPDNTRDGEILRKRREFETEIDARVNTLTNAINRADIIVGKSERSEQKPLKIGSGLLNSQVISTEVLTHNNAEAAVQNYLDTNNTDGIGELHGIKPRVQDFNATTHAKVTYSQIQAEGKFFRFTTGMMNVASIQKNDDQGRQISQLRYDPSKIGFFTSMDTYAKWAVTEVEIYIRNAKKPPKFVTISGNLPEQLVWQMMLYCQHKGIQPLNKTKHSNLNDRYNALMEKPAEQRADLIEFGLRAKRLWPNNPEIHETAQRREQIDSTMQPPRP